MQVNLVGSDTHTSGDSGRTFGAKIGAKSFWLLSSGIYSRKVLAVIREVSCNAQDAHVMSGQKGRPIEVWLPTAAKPVFQVRDYGTGLSEDEIYRLYTQYFESNKDGNSQGKFSGSQMGGDEASSEATGGFGLGSKSPFSVTDQFTVTSAHGGKKIVYSCAVNHERVPETIKLWEGAADNDWPSGLMVTVPVPLSLVDEFWKEAARAYRPFDTIPAFMESEFVLPDALLPRAQLGAISIIPGAIDGVTGITARMAQVDYPLDIAALNLRGPLKKFIAALSDEGSQSILVRVPNGMVVPSPSRESLQYYKEAVTQLTGLLDEALAVATAEIKGCFNDIQHVNVDELNKLRTWGVALFKLRRDTGFGAVCDAVGLPKHLVSTAVAGSIPAPTIEPTGLKVFWYEHEGCDKAVRSTVFAGKTPGGKAGYPLNLPLEFKLVLADADRADGRVRNAASNPGLFGKGVLLLQRKDNAPMTVEDRDNAEGYIRQLMAQPISVGVMPLPGKRNKPAAGTVPSIMLLAWKWDARVRQYVRVTEDLREIRDRGGVWLRKSRRGWMQVDPDRLAKALAAAANAGLDISSLPPYVIEVDTAMAAKMPKDMQSLQAVMLTMVNGWIDTHGLSSQATPFPVNAQAPYTSEDWGQSVPDYLRGAMIERLRPILAQYENPSPLVAALSARLNTNATVVAQIGAVKEVFAQLFLDTHQVTFKHQMGSVTNPMVGVGRGIPGLIPTWAASLPEFKAMLALHEALWAARKGKTSN